MAIAAIEIIREQNKAQQKPAYRAIGGNRQAVGPTPGQALDTLERMLATVGGADGEGTLVIVQRFRPDAFFTAEEQARLQELMDRFHEAYASGQDLAPEEKEELERLVDAEWQAAIERGAAILKQAKSLTS